MSIYTGVNSITDLSSYLRSQLSPYLGTFNDGLKSVWVEPPQSPIAGNGVHVYIDREPKQVTGFQYKWNVTLILYGDLTPASLEKFDGAIATMRRLFPRRTEAIAPYQEGYLPQANFGLIFERFAYQQY